MGSTTSLVATQVRLHEWVEQIRECTNRPADMKVTDWCRMHGITKSNYYYRMKRVRQACLDTVSSDQPEFAELRAPQTLNSDPVLQSQVPSAVFHIGSVSADVYDCASEEFLTRLVRVMNHAE